jgi:hypothetical protein
MRIHLLLAVALCFFIVLPASALITNNTQDNQYISSGSLMQSASFVHDVNYIPVPFWYLLIIIGLGSLLVSKWEPAEDMFAPIAFMALAESAWYANFVAFDIAGDYTSVSGAYGLAYTQIITPQPAISVMLAICAFIALLNIYYIFFVKPNIQALEAKTNR